MRSSSNEFIISIIINNNILYIDYKYYTNIKINIHFYTMDKIKHLGDKSQV